MRKSNGNPTGPAEDADDLQQIKGIGQSTAQILNDLGIYRLADLIQYTNQDLVVRLKDHLPPLTLKRIEREDWIGQAHLLVQANRLDAPGAPLSTGWQEVADFFISLGYISEPNGKKRLQTKAHHSQADQMRQWEGIAMAELVQWILAQAGLSTSAEAPVAAPSAGPYESDPDQSPANIELELADLWISQVSLQENQGQGSKLRATCTLLLTGPYAETETYEQSSYQVEIYAVNRTTNISQLAGTCFGKLDPGQLGYSIQQDFDIPAVGSYQLYVLARLQTPGSPAAHIQGPVLQVES